MRRLFTAVALTCLMTLAACGGKEDDMVDMQKAESVAAKARADIDALAAMVGSEPQVQDDTLTDCVPGDRESGKMLSYGVQVQVADDALEHLASDVSERLAGEGWTVKKDTQSNQVRFQRGSSTIGATIFPDKGFAIVSGSGGCVT
jgi:hypothetical protein